MSDVITIRIVPLDAVPPEQTAAVLEEIARTVYTILECRGLHPGEPIISPATPGPHRRRETDFPRPTGNGTEDLERIRQYTRESS